MTVPSRTVVAGSRKRRLDVLRAAKLFRTGSHVQGMQSLVIIPGSVLGHRDHIDRPVRPGFWIDDRSRSDPDLWHYLAAAMIITGGFASGQGRDLPEHRTAIGIETVYAAMLRCDIQNIVCPIVGNALVKRLSVHFSIDRDDKQFAEPGRVNVGRSESRLGKILSAAGVVVVIRGHVGSGCAGRRQGWRLRCLLRVIVAFGQEQTNKRD